MNELLGFYKKKLSFFAILWLSLKTFDYFFHYLGLLSVYFFVSPAWLWSNFLVIISGIKISWQWRYARILVMVICLALFGNFCLFFDSLLQKQTDFHINRTILVMSFQSIRLFCGHFCALFLLILRLIKNAQRLQIKTKPCANYEGLS